MKKDHNFSKKQKHYKNLSAEGAWVPNALIGNGVELSGSLIKNEKKDLLG